MQVLTFLKRALRAMQRLLRGRKKHKPLKTHPSTGLLLGQEEALHLLMEECAEAIRAAAKVLRYGMVAQDASNSEVVVEFNNGANLDREIGHILAATHICHLLGLVSGAVHDHSKKKLETVQAYLHHIVLTPEEKK
jgi:hypothetical protein